MKYIHALFGMFVDAYTILAAGDGTASTTSLDTNDVALVVTEGDGLQLYLPANGKISDQGLALVQIYNAMCRCKAGVVDGKGDAIPENTQFQGFTSGYANIMKARVGE